MTNPDTDRSTVYLNTADLEALTGLGLSKDQAQAVMDSRPIREWGDLKRIEGVDQDQINAIKSAGGELGEATSGAIREPGSGGSVDTPAGNLGRA